MVCWRDVCFVISILCSNHPVDNSKIPPKQMVKVTLEKSFFEKPAKKSCGYECDFGAHETILLIVLYVQRRPSNNRMQDEQPTSQLSAVLKQTKQGLSQQANLSPRTANKGTGTADKERGEKA